MIALLAMMPMRRRAFVGLTLNQSLIVAPEALTIVLCGDLTKTGVHWEADIPDPTAQLVRRYVAETRPYLMARGVQRHPMLWVGDDGRPLTYHHIGPKIATITKRLTGMRIPPHFFRDSAATTLARESPDSARLVRSVLGHSSFETSERHYNHARSIEAGRDYADVLRRRKGKR